ncbi:MAG: tRNA (adenosine(37)-N6)-threonylcarbamoyltransferase complex ATPase subunit type 1 TsaE, partial [Bacteroidales bacterium]|nr:tRNA (adenosine(37)-N6)-threonylcarbamoyltransferase complex ATPase subunit type 1 TsaE [Bacteroidales bacterium]
IKKIEEVYDFGFEDYFYSGNYCFIEWPELITDILPENAVLVKITIDQGGTRILEIG